MPINTVPTTCLVILTGIATASVLYVAQSLFAPMLAALVLGVVFAPLTDQFEKFGLPRVLAAFVTLLGLVVFIGSVFFLIEPTLSAAIRNAPLIWREIADGIHELRNTLSGIEEMQKDVEDALGSDESGNEEKSSKPVAVPGVMEALAYAPSVAAAIMIFLGTLYFFLVARSDIYAYLSRKVARLSNKTLCAAEARVSRYFVTITAINASFGVLVGVVLFWLGVSHPFMWGMGAFLVNYVLYLGPAFFAVALVIAGAMQFDGVYVVAPAAIYLSMNMTEGQFVTPSLVGHHMQVNPLLVFVSLIFWLWLWGPIGGIIAIPILVWSLFLLNAIAEDNEVTDAVG